MACHLEPKFVYNIPLSVINQNALFLHGLMRPTVLRVRDMNGAWSKHRACARGAPPSGEAPDTQLNERAGAWITCTSTR